MSKKVPNEILSHWTLMIEGLEVSPQLFFRTVEDAVKRRNIEGVKFSRYHWKEGTILSAKREYLRVKRKDYAYDICGAPFANGFFVSSWLGDFEAGWLTYLFNIPILGPIIRGLFKPVTYFRIDTGLIFNCLVHGAVLEAIELLSKPKGLRALTPEERKPEMRNFFDK